MRLSPVPRRPLCTLSGPKNNSALVSWPRSRRRSRYRVHSKGEASEGGGDDADLKERSSNDVDAKRPKPPPPDPSCTTGQAADAAYGWSDEFSASILASSSQNLVADLPLAKIRRPLARSRADDELKVAALAASMREHGQREPIDVLECPPDSGKYWGFSGCHRFAAAKALGWETIRCRVRKVSEATLRMHLA